MSQLITNNREDKENLAVNYMTGTGVIRNRAKAMILFHEAAEEGSVKAMLSLAMLYQAGHFMAACTEDVSSPIEIDLTQSAHWYEKCANEGNAFAQNYIGNAYNYGHGVDIDYEKAVYWYLQSAENGFAASQRQIGTMLLNGIGVQEDRQVARYWLARSYNKGKEVKSRPAPY